MSPFADNEVVSRTLRSEWPLSIPLYACLLPLFMLATYSRSGIGFEEFTATTRLIISLSAPLSGFLLFALVSLSARVRQTRNGIVGILLTWAAAGATSALTAATLRSLVSGEPIFSATNVVLGAVFTTIILALASSGMATLADRRRQQRLLRRQQRRLLELRSRAEGYAEQQSKDLALAIATTVAPEINRLRRQVAAIGVSPSADFLTHLHAEVSDYTSSVVRSISHEISEPPSAVTTDRPARTSTLGQVIDLTLSARINLPIMGVAAALLFIAQFNLGCTGVPAMAVMGFLAVTLTLGLVGQWGPFRMRPWGLVWLVVATVAGFSVYRLILDTAAPRCRWAEPGPETVAANAVSVILLLAITAIVEGARQASSSIQELHVTNDALTTATEEFNVQGNRTREQISEILHGPVQGRLAAVSFALRIHLDELARGHEPSVPDLQIRIDSLLEQAANDLDRLAHWQEASSASVVEQLEALILPWAGLVDVTLDVSDEAVSVLKDHPDAIARLVSCAEEALTNSSRHGQARHAQISVLLLGDREVTMTVEDDGIGTSSHPHEGLGLQCITESGATWHLGNGTGGGALLTATWPVSAKSPA